MQLRYFTMKQLLLILTITLLWKHCYAQSVNLVPNPSFEDTLSCPDNQAQIYNAPPWFQPTANTPDYFNKCSNTLIVGVPTNTIGFQIPKTGNAYAGIAMCYWPFCINNRDYVSVPLNSTLVSNKKYCVKFYVSLANLSSYAISNIGAYFSSVAPSSSTIDNLPYTPQVQNPGNNIISDTTNWVLISGNFIANGGEKYLTIGNFNDDATTIKDTINNPGYITYYYIDDVYVGDYVDDSSSTLTVPNIFTPNNDGLNDYFKITTTNIASINCKIYNRWGILVNELTKTNEVWDGLTTSGLQCTNGIYYYVLTVTGNDGKEYEQKGFVQLIR